MVQRGEEVDGVTSTMTPLWRDGEKGQSTMTPLLTEWERGSLQESGCRSRTLCLLAPPQQIVDEGGLTAMVERSVDSVPGGVDRVRRPCGVIKLLARGFWSLTYNPGVCPRFVCTGLSLRVKAVHNTGFGSAGGREIISTKRSPFRGSRNYKVRGVVWARIMLGRVRCILVGRINLGERRRVVVGSSGGRAVVPRDFLMWWGHVVNFRCVLDSPCGEVVLRRGAVELYT